MEEIEVSKAKMDALKALADTNIAVSRAKETLQVLEENEAKYLLEREKKVVERVGKALNDSAQLVEQTIQNYELVKGFSDSVTEAGKKVSEVVESIEKHSALHEARVSAWEAKCNEQDAWISEQKKVIHLGHISLNSEKEGIEKRKKLLDQIERKLVDERGTLERAIKRLKEGKI